MAYPALSPRSPVTPARRGGRRDSGVYRFWRDLGYALGVVLAQAAGLSAAVIVGGR